MKVSNNKNLAHLWASQNVESATGSNFSFEGNKLYSYTTQIGSMINDKNGVTIVLLSEYGYSNTTRKHLSFAANANSHRPVYFTKNVEGLLTKFEYVIQGARELIEGYLKELPENFRADTNKANNIYRNINQQIELIDRIGTSNLIEINVDNAKQWRSDFLGGIAIKNVERSLGDVLNAVKFCNKAVDEGGFISFYQEFPNSLKLLIELKSKADSLGVKVPTGTATAIKKAKVNVLISLERQYANSLTKAVADYRRHVDMFIRLEEHLFKDKTNRSIKSAYTNLLGHENELNHLLKNQPTLVLPVPLVTPLESARAYLNLAIHEELQIAENEMREAKTLAVNEWRLGNASLQALDSYNEIYLRIAGKTIQTSHSAEVPLSVATKLWRLIQVVIKRGEDMTGDFGESVRVGHHTLNAVYKDGSIKVGCHTIAYGELELLAKQLGFV